MNMPGFTAEYSIYESGNFQTLTASDWSEGNVRPQLCRLDPRCLAAPDPVHEQLPPPATRSAAGLHCQMSRAMSAHLPVGTEGNAASLFDGFAHHNP